MYAQKFRVEVVTGEKRQAAPLEWLDAFCMRNFTGSAEFDDTLPVADGEIEASLKVNAERFAAAFGEWLKKRGKVGGEQAFRVEVRAVELEASKNRPTSR
jgi:hypothetical protein